MALEQNPALAHREHIVQFYESDAALTDLVVAYLTAAVVGGDAVVAIATGEHLAAFTAGLTSEGIDVPAAVSSGALVLLDSASTLRAITIDGKPDGASFDAVVGETIRAAADAGRSVRAYGEMVAVLWAEGNVAGALELEQLWNDLAARHPFSLFCAYPADLVADPGLAHELAHVCHLHSAVVESSSSDAAVVRSQHFAPAVDAPRGARRFVGRALRGWSLDHLVEPCQVVVSELATNAVRHADSRFSVSLSRIGRGAVHIAVGDLSDAPPEQRTPDAHRPGGRGMHLVESLSQRWGHVVASDGKLVWAVVGEVD